MINFIKKRQLAKQKIALAVKYRRASKDIERLLDFLNLFSWRTKYATDDGFAVVPLNYEDFTKAIYWESRTHYNYDSYGRDYTVSITMVMEDDTYYFATYHTTSLDIAVAIMYLFNHDHLTLKDRIENRNELARKLEEI